MDPIGEINRSFTAPQSGATVAEFLRFLEQLNVVLEQLNEVVSQAKDAIASNSSSFPVLALRHQVRVLSSLEKTSSAIRTFLEEEGLERCPSKAVARVRALLEVSRFNTQPREKQLKEKERQGRVYESRSQELRGVNKESSGSYAQAPLPRKGEPSQPVKGMNSQLFSETAVSGKLRSVSVRPSDASFHVPWKTAPISDALKTVKPLLEHLLVVVETQENMAKPSEKLLHLAEGLMRDSSLFSSIDFLSFIKNALPEVGLKKTAVSKGGEKTGPEGKTVDAKGVLSLSSKMNVVSAASLPMEEKINGISRQNASPTAFMVPYPIEQKMERSRTKPKKKDPHSRASKEEEMDEEADLS